MILLNMTFRENMSKIWTERSPHLDQGLLHTTGRQLLNHFNARSYREYLSVCRNKVCVGVFSPQLLKLFNTIRQQYPARNVALLKHECRDIMLILSILIQYFSNHKHFILLSPGGSHLIWGYEDCKGEQFFQAGCCKSVAALNSQRKRTEPAVAGTQRWCDSCNSYLSICLPLWLFWCNTLFVHWVAVTYYRTVNMQEDLISDSNLVKLPNCVIDDVLPECQKLCKYLSNQWSGKGKRLDIGLCVKQLMPSLSSRHFSTSEAVFPFP